MTISYVSSFAPLLFARWSLRSAMGLDCSSPCRATPVRNGRRLRVPLSFGPLRRLSATTLTANSSTHISTYPLCRYPTHATSLLSETPISISNACFNFNSGYKRRLVQFQYPPRRRATTLYRTTFVTSSFLLLHPRTGPTLWKERTINTFMRIIFQLSKYFSRKATQAFLQHCPLAYATSHKI